MHLYQNNNDKGWENSRTGPTYELISKPRSFFKFFCCHQNTVDKSYERCLVWHNIGRPKLVHDDAESVAVFLGNLKYSSRCVGTLKCISKFSVENTQKLQTRVTGVI